MLGGGIDIGELDTRLTIERASKSNHEVNNQEIKSWSTLKTIWAKELGPVSRERFEANQQVAIDEARFFARWKSVFATLTADLTSITADNTHITADNLYGIVKVVDETMRCIRKGEVLYIDSIESSGRRGWVIIRATRRNNG